MTGPVVSLEFKEQGATDLSKAFDRVGASSKGMADDINRSSDAMRDSGRASERLSEGFDTTDTRAMGFRDTLTGLQDGFEGLQGGGENMLENMLLLGTGVGDLASGMVNFLIPTISTLWAKLVGSAAATWALGVAQTAWTAITTAATAAMHLLNAAMKANPILLIVSLILILVMAFLGLWQRSEAFRNFFIGMWNGIKNVVSNVVDWIVRAWNGIVDFFSNLPQRIGQALGAIGGFFQAAFKGAANLAIDAVNWMISRINDLIYGVNLISPFGDIPSIPHIRRMHTGGVVPGMPGEEVMMMMQAGETVSTSGQGGSGVVVGFVGDTNSVMANAFMKLIRDGDIIIQGVND
jgi:phage-related protein